MSLPLVSALTPTYNRRDFFPRSVEIFLTQDYPNLEWIILDDSDTPIKDLIPDDPRIKYFYELPKCNHGEKMNRCMELSQGEYGLVWDDDDWYAPNRITRQIIPMAENFAIELTGSSTIYYYTPDHKAYQYRSPNAIWLASIAVRKSSWARHPFDTIPGGADYTYQLKTPWEAKYNLDDPTLVVAAAHPGNACKKGLGHDYQPVPWEVIEDLWKPSTSTT